MALTDPGHSRDAAEETPHPVPAAEVWRLIAPWLGHVFLAVVAVLGLFTASAASDAGTYVLGLATFALAVIITAVRINRQLDGRETGFLLDISITSGDALLVAIALLTGLGLVGAILAASMGGTVYDIGVATFVVCAALIFFLEKRFFDAHEAGH